MPGGGDGDAVSRALTPLSGDDFFTGVAKFDTSSDGVFDAALGSLPMSLKRKFSDGEEPPTLARLPFCFFPNMAFSLELCMSVSCCHLLRTARASALLPDLPPAISRPLLLLMKTFLFSRRLAPCLLCDFFVGYFIRPVADICHVCSLFFPCAVFRAGPAYRLDRGFPKRPARFSSSPMPVWFPAVVFWSMAS